MSVCVLSVLLLSVGVASAGLFDFLKSDSGITGNVVSIDGGECGEFAYATPISVETSGDHSGTYNKGRAIDKNKVTTWFSPKGKALPQWISFDFGKEVCINSVNTYLYYGGLTRLPLTFDVEISKDNSSWEKVAENWLISDKGYNEKSFDAKKARYVRIMESLPEGSRAVFGMMSEFTAKVADFTAVEPMPNLVVSSFDIISTGEDSDSTVKIGNSLKFRVGIKNVGEADFFGVLSVDVFSEEKDGLGDWGERKQVNIQLPSDSVLYSLDFTDINAPVSNEERLLSNNPHYFKAVVDYDGQVEESNETDNTYESTIKINVESIPENTCEDTDGGLDYYTRGQTKEVGDCTNGTCTGFDDLCKSSTILLEGYCNADNQVANAQYTCQYGCSDGACLTANNQSNQTTEPVCPDLLNKVKNPVDFSYDWKVFETGGSETYNSDWWINGKSEKYMGYSAYWNNWDGAENKNNYVSYSIMVFENKNVDLSSWLNDLTDYNICQVREHWMSDEKSERYYVCNWNAGSSEQIQDYSWDRIDVYWFKNNVAIQMNLNSGGSLTEEEKNKLMNEKFGGMLNDLIDNNYEYASWEDFSVDWTLESQIYESLKLCSSDVKAPVDEDGTECSPSWSCKTEPIICPPHGYQTKTCVDNGCDGETEAQIYCSPGVCSGCYVPRWFEGKDNTCIPYGIRFEQQVGSEKKFYSNEDTESITEGSIDGGGVYVNILSETGATITFSADGFENHTVSLIEGQKADLKFDELEEGNPWKEELSEGNMILYVEEVVPESGENKGYVTLTVSSFGYYDSPTTVNAYCDIDGRVKEQRIKNYDGSWAKCQNNYECDSNLCSGGECVEINDAIRSVSSFKGTFVKVLCRFSNLFDGDNYEQCVGQYLGY